MSKANPFGTQDPLEAVRIIADHHSADSEERKLWTDHWFSAFDAWVQRTAWGSLLNYGRGRAQHLLDDIEQITRFACLELINDCCSGAEDPSAIRSLKGLIQLKTRNNIRDELERYEQRGVTGATSKVRRARELDLVEHDLAQQTMRQPSRAEVIEEFNRRQYAQRKDPERQGRIAEDTDIGYHLNAPAPMEHEHTVVDEDPDCVISPIEGREFRTTLLRRSAEHSEQLGLAAEAFLGQSLEATRTEFGVMEAIRKHANYRSRKEAKAAVDEIRWLSRTVLVEDYGITEADL